MTDAELARDNTAEAFLAFASAAPKAQISRSEHYYLCTSSLKHSLANFAVHLNLETEHVEQLAERARANSCFRIHVMTGDSPTTLLGMFEATGLSESHHLKLMAARAGGVMDSSVVEVQPKDAKLTAAFIVDQFFWTAAPNIRARVTEMATCMASDPRQITYAIHSETGLEAAATAFFTDAVAGLYNVCVRPESRGRGLGAALVGHVCHMASFRTEKIVLQCGEFLAGWYRDLGFREVGESVALASP